MLDTQCVSWEQKLRKSGWRASFAPATSTAKEVTTSQSQEVMDDDEQFEQLQMQRVMAENPESLAFVRARKTVDGKKPKPRK